MSLSGFDPKWRDLPDFILGITQDIWEHRNIDRLRDYYADDIVVRSPACVVVGNEGVIAATMATLAEWPDRELPGEDVIWCGSPEKGTLYSSHRLVCTATHTQSGYYGEATGKRLHYRILADCACRNNQIYDEWLVRDQGAIVRQMGWEPKAFAADLIDREGGPDSCVSPYSLASDVAGGYNQTGNDSQISGGHADILTAIMAGGISAVTKHYDRAAHLELPGGQCGTGHRDADIFWLGVRSAFPDAEFVIHHSIGMEEEGRPPRSALRWTLCGQHSGWGRFGAPSGAQVTMMGISHAEFGPRGLHREWVLFDETAIWKQILLHTG